MELVTQRYAEFAAWCSQPLTNGFVLVLAVIGYCLWSATFNAVERRWRREDQRRDREAQASRLRPH